MPLKKRREKACLENAGISFRNLKICFKYERQIAYLEHAWGLLQKYISIRYEEKPW
jgi:hypothetical protein